MRRYFEQFGEILEAVVITDKNTGRSKGYGFVTFREPEAAKRACADPTPMIDGRRANCNLASLGRPRPPLPYGRLRPATPFIASVQTPRGTYVGNFGYQQPLPYNYQQGLMYHPYGYATYGPEYVYPQGVYNPYAGQQYLQVYGVPGTVNTAIYPYGQLGKPFLEVMVIQQCRGMGAHVPAQPQFIVPAPSPQYMQGSSSDQTAG
ncbi:hypothetical protein GH714_017277 [Hevea brasiliensis]|uniref:RRM domain-containing protein n=1 Tax=Hevea brasiliensis TaxID=3981 RepID=A0A6A6NI38_HEVBR|nr:hypothetical protein GH714_017277 [Hevea brasiliensis]